MRVNFNDGEPSIIDTDVKRFIKEYWNLIEDKKFDELYTIWYAGEMRAWTSSCLTYYFLNAGIDPLDYMSYIPSYYAVNLDIESIDIPSNIVMIKAEAFRDCKNLKELNIPSTVNALNDLSLYGLPTTTRFKIPKKFFSRILDIFGKSINFAYIKWVD